MEPRRDQPTMTFEEAAGLDADVFAGELDQGKWTPVTRGTWRHGQIVGNAYVLLRQHARSHAGWSASVADPGTKLQRAPDVLRGPDTAIVRSERVPAGTGAEGWLDGAPDVAVEALGDAQPLSDLMKKALEYLGAGGKMVWILDPEPQRVMLVTPPGHVRVLEREETLDGGDVLPGFGCKVAELFE
ncbi:MAG: Uma2 family endonuclease [Deltaproteobacteria bacterium]|nr:Uma2 family endonuclease [Deltaproteobacteria bacterium]